MVFDCLVLINLDLQASIFSIFKTARINSRLDDPANKKKKKKFVVLSKWHVANELCLTDFFGHEEFLHFHRNFEISVEQFRILYTFGTVPILLKKCFNSIEVVGERRN